MLLVHGFSQNRHAWTSGQFVKNLLFFGIDIHILELRGHGKSSIVLQKERSQLGSASAASLSEVLIGVSDFYRSRLKAKRAIDPSDDLRVSIDRSLETVAQEKRHSGRASLDALVGLRRALFPHAEPPASWRPPVSDTNQPLPIAAE